MRCSCFVRWLCFVCSAAALAACAPADAGSPRAWIDIPLDGSDIVAGTEIEVLSHASAQAGVAEVMLAVDGVPYRRDPPEEHGAQFSRVRPPRYVLCRSRYAVRCYRHAAPARDHSI